MKQSKPLVVFLLLLSLAVSIRFQPLIEGYSQQCIYEHLDYQAKYRFYLSPQQQNKFINYTFELQYLHDDNSKILYSHEANTGVDQIVNLHKFAGAEGIHGFCIKNHEARQTVFIVKLESGIQLMELQGLPAAPQAQIIQKQLEVLRAQYGEVLNSLTSVEGRRQVTQQLFLMMSSKAVGIGAIGIGVIILVNLVFYRLIKRSLQERKRI